MNLKLFDSELKVMDLIWENEPVSAKELSLLAAEETGWNKNTTYTVIKRLEAKEKTQNLIDKLFGGSRKALFSALLEDEKLSKKELKELRKMIDER